MMVVVMTMVMLGSERWTCNHHKEQHSNKNPLHATNLA